MRHTLSDILHVLFRYSNIMNECNCTVTVPLEKCLIQKQKRKTERDISILAPAEINTSNTMYTHKCMLTCASI